MNYKFRPFKSAFICFILLVFLFATLQPRPAKALSHFEAVVVATFGGFIIGTIWYDTRQSPWRTWWETSSNTGAFLGLMTLILWEDAPQVKEFEIKFQSKLPEYWWEDARFQVLGNGIRLGKIHPLNLRKIFPPSFPNGETLSP